MLADEPLGVGGVGAIKYASPSGDDLCGTAVVYIGRVSSPIPLWRYSAYQQEKSWQNPRASWIEPNRSGKVV